MSEKHRITQEEIDGQLSYISRVAAFLQEKQKAFCAFIQTFGCQQNEADSERLAGMLSQMGYQLTEQAAQADVIVVNTCAVRENAENRALGHIGAMAHLKKTNPGLIICLCGCMAQEKHIGDKIRASYPQVDLLFGPQALWRFPELLYRTMTEKARLFDTAEPDNVAEGLPVRRADGVRAWLSVMYGCNNFCTYCIVPYVRGRERSRKPADIEHELRELVEEGYRDITLLGQNVNSYGKDLEETVDFASLLRRLNDVPGDFLLRFMTSHPKDASLSLFDAMRDCPKVARQLHLPVQSGSDIVLKRMNRGYTAAQYCELIAAARERMPELALSSDIIVGFPGETEEDFAQTLQLVEKIGYDMLYTFLYSKREGTPAAEYPDSATAEEKQERFERLLKAQDGVAQRRMDAYLGKRLRVLIDGKSKNVDFPLSARTEGGLLVLCASEGLPERGFAQVKIIRTSLRTLYAQAVK